MSITLNLSNLIKLAALALIALSSSFSPALSAPDCSAQNLHQPELSKQASMPAVIAWKAADEKAVLVAVHGFALNKCSFRQFAEAMKRRGVSTYALDVRGFGSWAKTHEGRRLSFKTTIADLHDLIVALRTDAPDRPIFLMGESMGGAIALHFAAQYPDLTDGVIASVPGSERYRSLTATVKLASALILKAGGPVSVADIVVERSSIDRALKNQWRHDGLARFNMSLFEVLTFNGFMKDNHRQVRKVATPVLLVQGEKDNLVRPSGAQRLFTEIASPDKQLLLLKDGQHLTFEEGQFSESTLNKVDNWISNHIYKNEVLAQRSL